MLGSELGSVDVGGESMPNDGCFASPFIFTLYAMGAASKQVQNYNNTYSIMRLMNCIVEDENDTIVSLFVC